MLYSLRVFLLKTGFALLCLGGLVSSACVGAPIKTGLIEKGFYGKDSTLWQMIHFDRSIPSLDKYQQGYGKSLVFSYKSSAVQRESKFYERTILKEKRVTCFSAFMSTSYMTFPLPFRTLSLEQRKYVHLRLIEARSGYNLSSAPTLYIHIYLATPYTKGSDSKTTPSPKGKKRKGRYVILQDKLAAARSYAKEIYDVFSKIPWARFKKKTIIHIWSPKQPYSVPQDKLRVYFRSTPKLPLYVKKHENIVGSGKRIWEIMQKVSSYDSLLYPFTPYLFEEKLFAAKKNRTIQISKLYKSCLSSLQVIPLSPQRWSANPRFVTKKSSSYCLLYEKLMKHLKKMCSVTKRSN